MFFLKILITILFLNSCSLFLSSDNELEDSFAQYQFLTDEDYLNYYEYLSQNIIISKNKKIVRLSKNTEKYINGLLNRLITLNTLFFKNKKKFNVKIIRDARPFHFSIPQSNIFLSTGLLKKYIKNEGLLVSVFLFELIRSEKNIYKKNYLLPKSLMSIEELLSLLRLSSDQKINIHKWAYYLMRRSLFDEEIYLQWLQTQNRNYLDFSLHLGETSSIFKEEHRIRDFIVKNYRNKKRKETIRNTSRDFYKLLKEIR